MTQFAAPPDSDGLSPYSPAGPDALGRLGLDLFAPMRELRETFQRLLPAAAADGYFGALRAALQRGEVAPGDGRDQLRWLAEHLQLTAPGDDDPFLYWRESWTQAVKALDVPAPRELGLRAKQALLEELLRLPEYQSRLADAIVRAFQAELKR